MDGLVAAALRATIGLTGGIGSGKTTVAQQLAACGAQVVDTDAIARSLTLAGGAAMPALAAEFGPQVLTPEGALDRLRMRRLAFADAAVKARLEAILHPLIGSVALSQAAAGDTALPVVFDVPLLAESGHWRERVDRVLVIDCAESTQTSRVAQRPGWNLEAAQRVLVQQAPRAMRRAIADAVIHNDDLTLDQLEAAVHRLWALWFGARA